MVTKNINSAISSLNNNTYFYGIMMIFLNMGAKYIELDLEPHRKFLSSKVIRRFLIFTVAFIATRDILVSLIITATFIILVLNLFNSSSNYCILPKSMLDTNKDGEVSVNEIKAAYQVLQRANELNKL